MFSEFKFYNCPHCHDKKYIHIKNNHHKYHYTNISNAEDKN